MVKLYVPVLNFFLKAANKITFQIIMQALV